VASFADYALQGASITLSTKLSGPVTFDLTGALSSGGPPNPILAWLQPQVTIVKNGELITTLAPYGNPPAAPDWEEILLVLGLLGILLVVFWRKV
jgi:hypothetical protein